MLDSQVKLALFTGFLFVSRFWQAGRIPQFQEQRTFFQLVVTNQVQSGFDASGERNTMGKSYMIFWETSREMLLPKQMRQFR
jgi:hypothetical protein